MSHRVRASWCQKVAAAILGLTRLARGSTIGTPKRVLTLSSAQGKRMTVDEDAVRATLEEMARATIARDVATLDRIYGDDVTYSHASGRTDTKAEVLENIRGPAIAEFMKFSDMTVRVYGDVALAKGITDFRNGRPGNLTDNHLNILWVMVRRPQGPFGWQIVARQTTRIGPSVGTPVPSS